MWNLWNNFCLLFALFKHYSFLRVSTFFSFYSLVIKNVLIPTLFLRWTCLNVVNYKFFKFGKISVDSLESARKTKAVLFLFGGWSAGAFIFDMCIKSMVSLRVLITFQLKRYFLHFFCLFLRFRFFVLNLLWQYERNTFLYI